MSITSTFGVILGGVLLIAFIAWVIWDIYLRNKRKRNGM